jgi:hypothetical protein
VNANPFQTEVGLELAIDRLLENGRVHEAVLCFERIIQNKQPLDNQQAIRTLYAVLESPGNVITHDAYAIVDIIKTLQETPKTDVEEISNIEWAFLPLLDKQYEASPKLLGRKLADEPNFFCEVIRLIFRSRNEEKPKEERSEQQTLIATNGYRLLQSWKTPPGSHERQPFNGSELNDWLAVVKTSCAKSGHLEVALQRVGNTLFYSPPDPDGLWLHHSVASVLNARDADDIRTGFKTEVFNSRGVFFVDPQGRPERELAEKYRGRADEVEVHGYHRLATALREVAASYDRQAERQASRADLDDD